VAIMLRRSRGDEAQKLAQFCGDISELSLICANKLGSMIYRDAGSVSPSPRFAESAEQNGERAGVGCFVFILVFKSASMNH
jgi:hypothetical protein